MKKIEVDSDRQVILVTGGAAKWFEQAIFVVKKSTKPADIPTDFVAEAERIVNRYLHGQSRPGKAGAIFCDSIAPTAHRRTKKRRGDLALSIAMLLCCAILSVIIAKLF